MPERERYSKCITDPDAARTIQIPREQWTRLMRELRDIRAKQSEVQSDLARVLGELSDYATESIRPAKAKQSRP
jgi:hypothetical protein